MRVDYPLNQEISKLIEIPNRPNFRDLAVQAATVTYRISIRRLSGISNRFFGFR